MAILSIPSSGMVLEGTGSSRSPSSGPTTVVALTLSDSVIEEMIKSAMTGKSLQLSLGNDPKIIYGDMAQHLSSNYDPFSYEIYKTPYSKNPPPKPQPDTMVGSKLGLNAMMFKGKKPPVRIVRTDSKGKEYDVDSANAAANPRDAATSGTDNALATLRASIASEDARKTAKTTKLIKQTDLAKGKNASNKSRFLGASSFATGTARSMPSSPSLNGVGSPRHGPTSAPLSFSEQQAEKAKAIRNPIIHVLAIEPATETRLHRLKREVWTEEEFQMNIDKVADKDGSVYSLRQKNYKDLDVWKYNYDEDDRQKAIDNAVRAYDKMRLEASAPEWERLLPKEERGSGKCLSKLQAKIATGTAKPPKINVQKPDGSGSGAEEGAAEDLFGHVKKGEGMARSNSQPPATKPKKASEKEAQAKRLLGRGAAAKPQASKPVSKPAVKKAAQKQEDRFLSSQFVEDSDDDDLLDNQSSPEKSHSKPPAKPRPVKQSKPSAPKRAVSPMPMPKKRLESPAPIVSKKESPTKAAVGNKRARSDEDNSTSGSSDTPIAQKRAKPAPPAPKGLPAKPPPSQVQSHAPKRRSSDESLTDSPPLKRAKPAVDPLRRSPNPSAHRASDASVTSRGTNSSAASSYGNPVSRPRSGRQKSSPLASSPPTNATDLDDDGQHSYTSSSSTSREGGKVREQPKHVMDLAKKFKMYYESYLKDYKRLEGKKGREEEVEKLLEMHERLKEMKRRICAEYVR